MKLLFDENLSPRLPKFVGNEYPGSLHVRDVELTGSTDAEIWEFAKANGFAIVSKDDDFRQRSFLEGAPPKVIWLQVGNAGTRPIADLLRRESARLCEFEAEEESALLIVRNAV